MYVFGADAGFHISGGGGQLHSVFINFSRLNQLSISSAIHNFCYLINV